MVIGNGLKAETFLNFKSNSKVVNNNLRYIDWSDRNGNFSANLNIEDLAR